MRISETDILIVPGFGACGPEHWQRRWGSRLATARFIEPPDRPVLGDWIGRIRREILMSTRPVVLIAHSLGVSAAVHAAAGLADTKTRGALLVAPPDHEADALPAEAASFSPVPRDPLPFASLLVASTDDPLCTVERAADMAACWGSELHLARNAGRIDAASGHGPWPEGLMMFTRLMQRI
jgi:predicted alpha/beta hydrolase family esterase